MSHIYTIYKLIHNRLLALEVDDGDMEPIVPDGADDDPEHMPRFVVVPLTLYNNKLSLVVFVEKLLVRTWRLD